MPKVYARVPGAEIRIDTYGVATESTPALVPQAVADELARDATLRVEADEPAPRKSKAATPAEKE